MSARVMETYLQEIAAVAYLPAMAGAQKKRIFAIAAGFTSVLLTSGLEVDAAGHAEQCLVQVLAWRVFLHTRGVNGGLRVSVFRPM